LLEWDELFLGSSRLIIGSDVIEFFQRLQHLLELLQPEKNADTVAFAVGHILLL